MRQPVPKWWTDDKDLDAVKLEVSAARAKRLRNIDADFPRIDEVSETPEEELVEQLGGKEAVRAIIEQQELQENLDGNAVSSSVKRRPNDKVEVGRNNPEPKA